MKVNDTMQEYLANSGVGSSSLKLLLTDTPQDFFAAKNKPSKETASTAKGTLWHSYVLERDLYYSEHLVQPECWGPLNKNPGREKWGEFKKTAEGLGKKPVKFEDAKDLLELDKAIEKHSVFKEMIENAQVEVSFYAQIDGMLCKSREDLLLDNAVWDIKTTRKTPDTESLEKVIFENGYHLSAAHHMNVMKAAGTDVNEWGWAFISTETPIPHIVLKKASNELLEAGQRDWQHAMSILKMCHEKDSWPGYDEEITEIGLPDWVERKYY